MRGSAAISSRFQLRCRSRPHQFCRNPSATQFRRRPSGAKAVHAGEFKLQATPMTSSKDKQLMGTEPSGAIQAAHACAASRSAIKTFWNANQGDRTALSLALDDCLDVDSSLFGDTKLNAAIEHISQCSACLEWRKSELEPERYEWIRMSQAYCCTEMFHAVQGADAGLAIRFGLAGPESLPCWWVEPSKTVIRHCPWCGSSLTQMHPHLTAATRSA